MTEPETIYTTTYHPDTTRAVEVLAFLLVPTKAFFGPNDDMEQMRAVDDLLNDAKRDALLNWYAHATGRRL